MKKNILVLYTAVGKGHKTMAENIVAALDPEQYEIDTLDLFKHQQSNFINSGTAIYLWILDFIPWLWNFFYVNKTLLRLMMPWRTKLAGLHSAKILKVLQSKNYDIVISTQVNPSAIVSYLTNEKLFKGKFVISFSDYHLQTFWLYKNADMYLVNIPEQKEQMIKLGYQASKIFVIGMALPEKQKIDSQEVRKKYGLSVEDKVLLVMGGTMGYKIKPQLIEGLLSTKAKVFIVCGNNEKIKLELEKQFLNNSDVRIFGFVDFMPELYSVASVVVSKPGGMTTAECLSYGLPLAVSNYLPGQEKINTEYLRAHKLVLPETNNIVKQVAEELETGNFVAQLRSNLSAKIVTQDSSTVKQAIAQL